MGNCKSDRAQNDDGKDKGNRPGTPGSKRADRVNTFTVAVHVCQARLDGSKTFGTADPYVQVTVDGEGDRTPVQHNTSRPIWNDSLKVSGFDKPPKLLKISCWDKDSLSPDDLIGEYEQELPQDTDAWDGKGVWKWLPISINGNRKGDVQVKIELHEVSFRDLNKFSHYDFSHLLEVTVKRADKLKLASECDRDFFVKTSWASNEFTTRTNRTLPAVWDETVYFLVDEKEQRDYRLTFNVIDDDKLTKDDDMGSAYIVPLQRDDSQSDRPTELKLPLRKTATTDKDLTGASTDESNYGYLLVEYTLLDKYTVFQDFFPKLMEFFDVDNDGKLTRHEAQAMLTTMQVKLSDDDFEVFWSAADRDGSDDISTDEARELLRALLFMGAESANATAHVLRGGIESLQKSLMGGVNKPQYKTMDRRFIDVYDREKGVIVKENIPHYITVALKALYSTKLGRFISGGGAAGDVMHRLTVRQGEKFDSPESVAEIPGFIKLHNLNVDEIARPLNEFKTMNEFFYRKLKNSARPIAHPEDPGVAVCPADCRMMVFPDVNEATKFWIKGDQFTLENFLGPKADLAEHLKNGSMVIARLAPQDYHRWHWPVCGKAGARTPIKGDLHTVNPIAINENVNVYTVNKREVCEIQSTEFGRVVLVAIGATMVGSINISTQPGDVVQKGDIHGYFAFGGSTVICLFEENAIKFDDILVKNSAKQLETLVKVNTSLGVSTK